MRKLTTLTALILATTTLFTACSNKDVKPKTEAELFNLQQERIAQLPLARTYPIERVSMIQPNLYTRTNYSVQQIPQRREFTERRVPMRRDYNNYHAQREENRGYRSYRNHLYNIISQVERSSKSLLGKKYVWGANGPYSYDCSSFTQKVFRDVGINIPRVSREQAKVGQYVRYEDLRKGDMVFFDTKKHRTGKVCHVGIYLGNGNFIHASSGAKKVVIFNFNEKEFYRKRFLWGRRVIQDNMHIASL